LTGGVTNPEALRVHNVKPGRPYFDAWLRRISRHFAVSGRLSQTALVLANENGGTPEEWRERLRHLLDGGDAPSLELLTRIDALLTGPAPDSAEDSDQGMLFQ
jgi:hypothetical protein